MVKPTLYDTGGWVPPGVHVVANQTRKPEAMITQKQLDYIAKGGTEMGTTVNNYVTAGQYATPAQVADAVVRRQLWEMR